MDIENYNETEKDDEIVNDILEENEPSFMKLIHSGAPITYDFSILVPKCESQKEVGNTKRLQKSQVSETDVLRKISTGHHQELLTHPVLRFFIWLKWSYIRQYMIRKLMLQFLSCYCISWYLLSKYSIEPDTETCFFDALYPILSDWCGVGSDNVSSSDNASSIRESAYRTLWIAGNNTSDFRSLPGCEKEQDDKKDVPLFLSLIHI